MSKKITNCKVCNAEIASNAKVCPSCGAKNKKPFFKKPIFWILVVLVVIIGAGIGSGGGETTELDYNKPEVSISADKIMQEYSKNSVTADETYKGKLIEVKGKISNISEYTIYLSGDDDENWLTSVDCSLASGQEDLIKSLSTGTHITVVGVVGGTGITGDIKLEKVKILTNDLPTQAPISVPENKDEVIELSVDAILKAYDDNSVSANEAYKGKTLKIKGKIRSIEEDYVILEGSDSWEFNSIYAYYVSSDNVKSLQSGEVITVTGTCSGEGVFSDIKLIDCSFSK